MVTNVFDASRNAINSSAYYNCFLNYRVCLSADF